MSIPVLSFIAAACGGDDDDDGASQTGGGETTAGAVQPGGTVRVALIQPTTEPNPLLVQDEGGAGMLGATGEYLSFSDENLELQPRLAESWEPNDDGSVWTFKIRSGVTFHNGAPMTSEDVVATFEKLINPDGGSANAQSALGGVLSAGNMEAPDETTVVFNLDAPNGNFPTLVSSANYNAIIIPADLDPADWGQTFEGTGPFKLQSFTPQQGATFVRNDAYWGEKPYWQKVTFRIIKNEAARVAALLSGDVDAIEQPPTADLARIKADPRFTVTSKISHRVIYFNFDHLERSSPFITAKDGKPLAKNPLVDPRVRHAISKAINRQAIADRVMEGQAIPSGQLVSDKLFGNVPGLKADAYDPEGAKKLLAQAGYPDGFNLTIHGPAGRYVNDEKIVQAVAQMLTRVGINSKVETAPMGPYSGRASKQEFSFHMVGWGASTGEASSPLRSLLATFNRDKGLGAVNWGRYSNVKVDYLIEQALQQVDDENRRTMLQRATELAMSDLGLMPVHFQFTIWATKKNVQYTPRTDEYTLAFQFRPTSKQP